MKERASLLLAGTLLVGLMLIAPSTIALPALDVQPLLDQEPKAATAENRTLVETGGPLTPFLDFDVTNMTIIDGAPLQVATLERLFNSPLLQWLRPSMTMVVTNLSFQVEYTGDVPNIPFLRNRFASLTTIVNATAYVHFYDEPHTLTVTGFDGVFEFERATFTGGRPAHFGFLGLADGVHVTEPVR